MTSAAGHLDPRRTTQRPDERFGVIFVVGLLTVFGVLVLLFT